jgi:hypothetical protein
MAHRRGKDGEKTKRGKKKAPFGSERSSMEPADEPLTIEEFAARHGTGIGTMRIEPEVSPYPREIRILKCPKCEGSLFLSHPVHRIDMMIEAKRNDGPLQGLVSEKNKWLSSCWTAGCDFFIELKMSDLVKCPECGRHCMEGFTLYDHMAHQCTDKAAHPDTIRKAGLGTYIRVALLAPAGKA